MLSKTKRTTQESTQGNWNTCTRLTWNKLKMTKAENISEYWDITMVSNNGETKPLRRGKIKGFNLYKNNVFQTSLPYVPLYKRKKQDRD